jgi:hypothetical membrane protein
MPGISPSVVLAVLVGIFDTGLYLLVRGKTLAPFPFVLIAAILGAWAGDAVGGLAGLSILEVGDFHLPAAAIGTFVGIGLVELLSVLAAPRPAPPPGPAGS